MCKALCKAARVHEFLGPFSDLDWSKSIWLSKSGTKQDSTSFHLDGDSLTFISYVVVVDDFKEYPSNI